MWETNRQNGTFLCERVYDEMTGKARILSVKITADNNRSRKEAQKKLSAKINEAQPKKLHLSDLINMYNEEHEKCVRESTYKRDMHSLKTTLEIVGDVYADMLTAGYIKRKMIESGKENSTINELLKRFRTFLAWAYQNDYMSRDVMDKLKLLPDKSVREKTSNKYLERSELKTLTDAMELERHKLATEFLALSGLRFGEFAALNDEDIDDTYIHVTQTYNEGLCSLGPAKTATSVRDVYIQPELAEVIKKIRTCMKRQRMMYGYADKGYFICGIDGGRYGNAAFNKYLKQIADKVLPEKKVTAHVLRHTMTSLMAEAGVPLETISRRLGHEDSQITKRVYMHVTEARKQKENEQIKQVNLLA